MSELKKVTIIGLGSMGSVVAALLIKKGYRVTVWNRTKSKEAKLVEIGAHVASDVAAAVSASDIIIVSLATHSDSREVLENLQVEQALSGKTLIQLSTGTPSDAKARLVHFRPRLQVIQTAHARPRFQARRSVATGIPPPASLAKSSMMLTTNLTQLDRIDG